MEPDSRQAMKSAVMGESVAGAVSPKTYWSTAGINSGATFRIDGMPNDYEIAEVVSDTEIQLRRPYYGSNLSNQAYSIDPNRSSTILADLALRNAAMMGRYEKFIDDNYQTVAGESAYEIAKRLGKTTAATESAWVDEENETGGE